MTAPGTRRRTNPQIRKAPITADSILLYGTFAVVTLIFFLFTPYTYMLDDIKNSLLYSLAPALLLGAVFLGDFSRISWKTHASTMLLGLFVVAHLVSFAVNPHRVVGETVLWFQVACMTFTVVFALFVNSEIKLRRTMMFMVIICAVSTLIGLFLYAGKDFTGQIYDYATEHKWSREWRTLFYTFSHSKEMYSTILNSDFYAAFIIMTMPITLSIFFVEERLFIKTLAVATFLLMCVCLVFTNSNDSLMALVFIMCPMYFVMCFWYRDQLNLSKQLLLTFFVCGVFLALTVFVLMLPKLAVTWDFKAKAWAGREVLWLGGFWPWIYRNDYTMTNIDWTSIFFGTGPGGYRFYFPVFRHPDFFDNQINNVTTFGHNYYLDMLLEFGLCGLGLFLLFYLRVLYDGFRQIRLTQNRVHRLYQMAMVTGLCGIALQNFFSPNNRWAVCGMIFYSMFGFSMALHHLDNPGVPAPDSDVRAHRRLRIVRGALYVLAVCFLVRSFPFGIRYFEGAVTDCMARQLMETAPYRPQSEQATYMQASRLLFERAIKANPSFATSYYRLAHVLSSLGETDEAIRVYTKLHEINPHYSEIHYNFGTIYYAKALGQSGAEQIKTMEKSYEHLKEAARQELKPNVQQRAGSVCRELAKLYESAGRENDATRLYREARQYYWNIVNYEPRIVECVADRKKYYGEAEKEIARLAYRTGDLDEAEKMFERMYWEDPSRAEYLNALLAFFDSGSKLAKKRDFLEKAVHADPLDVALRKRLADTYKQMGDAAAYRRELQKIEVLEPGNRTALAGIYLASKLAGQQDRADKYAAKLRDIGLDPERLTTTALEALSAKPETSAPHPMMTSETIGSGSRGL